MKTRLMHKNEENASQCGSPSVDTILNPEHGDIDNVIVDHGGELVFSNIENTCWFRLNYPLKSFYFLADFSNFMDTAFGDLGSSSAETQNHLSILPILLPQVDTNAPDVKLNPLPKVSSPPQEMKRAVIDNKLLDANQNPFTPEIKCAGVDNNVPDVNQNPNAPDLNQNPSSQQLKCTNVHAAINVMSNKGQPSVQTYPNFTSTHERQLFIQSFIRESSETLLEDGNISQMRVVDLCSASVATFLRVSHIILYTNMTNIMSLVFLTRSYHRDYAILIALDTAL